jgi:hypothetical protein
MNHEKGTNGEKGSQKADEKESPQGRMDTFADSTFRTVGTVGTHSQTRTIQLGR